MGKKRRKKRILDAAGFEKLTRTLLGDGLAQMTQGLLLGDAARRTSRALARVGDELAPVVHATRLHPTTFWATDYGDAFKRAVSSCLEDLPEMPAGHSELDLDEAAAVLIARDLSPESVDAARFDLASSAMTLAGALLLLAGAGLELAFATAYPSARRSGRAPDEEAFTYVANCQSRFLTIGHVMQHWTEDPLTRLALSQNVPATLMDPRVDLSTERSLIKCASELLDTGNNAFELDAETVEVFGHTEVFDVPIEDIRMPYNAFQVLTPEDAVFFVRYGLENGTDVWQVHTFDRGCITLRWKPEYATLGDAWAELVKSYEQSGLDGQTRETGQWALRLVANLALYLTTNSAVVHNRGRRSPRGVRKTPLAKRKGRPTLRTLTSLKHSVEPVLSRLGSSRGTPSAHWVRGHWKRQAYGPRGQGLTKRIWIQPYLRGEGDVPEARIYTDVEETR